MPHDLINAKPVAAAVKEFFGSLAAVAVHGPDQPAVRDHAQAPRVGAGPGRPDARARRLRSARRAPDALRPRLPDRDAGRPEHRPDQLARALRRASTSTASSRRRTARSIDGKVTDEIVYLSAIEEGQYTIAQANAELDKDGTLRGRAGFVPRRNGEFMLCRARPASHYMDVSPQAARVGRGLADPVPRERRREPRADGLEHAAPGRAVLQRRSAAGRHRHGATRSRVDSGAAIAAPPAGIVDQVDATAHRRARDRARPRPASPASTSTPDEVPALEPEHLHQPAAAGEGRRHDRERRRDRRRRRRPTWASWRSGSNVLVAFMPWNGYNFEDSILISERVVADDVLHLDPHRGVRGGGARHQARAGRDHPRHPERRRGSAAQPRRGRASSTSAPRSKPATSWSARSRPRARRQMTPEEKLLRAIFGEKASDVKDTSLRVPPGMQGTVIDVRVFNRATASRRTTARVAIQSAEIERLARTRRRAARSSSATSSARLREAALRAGRDRGPKGLKNGSASHGRVPRRRRAARLVRDRVKR